MFVHRVAAVGLVLPLSTHLLRVLHLVAAKLMYFLFRGTLHCTC